MANKAENILMVGASGVGKTHLAIAIGLKAVQNRIKTKFISASDLMLAQLKANFSGAFLVCISGYFYYALDTNAVIQKCVVHQIRNSLKYVSYKDRKKIANELKSIYEADTIEIASANLTEFKERHKDDFPNIAKSWESNQEELSTYFRYSKPIRRLIYTTNPIESLNSVIKRRIKTKGSFPSIESAYKSLFLAVSEIQSKWNDSKIMDWYKILVSIQVPSWNISEESLK